MNRRGFIKGLSAGGALATASANALSTGFLADSAPEDARPYLDDQTAKDWLVRWEKNITGDSRNRYCDKELGEELGWLVSPFVNGFYFGYLATRDTKWLDQLVDWADSCVRRLVKEPDGFSGWPKSGTGGLVEEQLLSDSLLGETMLLRPLTLMAGEMARSPTLNEKYGAKARAFLALSEQIFAKWDSRGAWRETSEGGLWVAPAFGIDSATGGWTAAYKDRATAGFSNPDNKQNHIARWLIALYDVTKKTAYRDRAEKWWRVMKSRMRTRDGGKYFVWNYWEPGGPWDYKPDGSTRHWVGVHPNGGYYQIDVEGIVTAFEHGLVFAREDIDRLIATNRDFMWNQQVTRAKFRRIDGGEADPRWKDSPGVLWTALTPYDGVLRRIFVANHNPADWGGLSATPWFISLSRA